MRAFKPFIHFIHYTNTGQYFVNAVIKIPSGYSVISQEQAPQDDRWVITIFVKKFDNMSSAGYSDRIEEFSIEIEASDMSTIRKVVLQVKDFELRDGDSIEGTQGDPGDSENEETP